MTPISVLLTGFAGIASGTGKNVIKLDLSAYGDSELIAIVGPNGAGKSTLMDNLHPYRVMPSRASKPTPTAFSYFDQMDKKAMKASKELIWEHDGKLFKTLIDLTRSGKSQKQEAYLFELVNGQYVPFVMPSGVASDGKSSTYDDCVESILGKPEVFFTTLFGCQGKASLNSMTAGEVKSLLAAMLGVDSVKTLGVKANDVIKLLKPNLEAIKTASAPNAVKVAGLPGLLESEQVARLKLTGIIEAIGASRVAVRQATQMAANAQAAFEQQAELKSRRMALNDELASAKTVLTSAVEKVAKQYATARQSLDGQLKTVDDALKASRQAVTSTETQLRAVRTLLSEKPAAEQAKQKLDRVTQLLSSQKAVVESLELELEPLTALRRSIQECVQTGGDLKSQGQQIRALLESARVVSELAEEVPCKGTTMQGQCKLLADAIRAKNEVPTYTVNLSELGTKYQTEKKKAEGMQRLIDGLTVTEGKLKDARVQSDSLGNQRLALVETASKLRLMPQAEVDETTLVQRLSELKGEQVKLVANRSAVETNLASLETAEKSEADTAFNVANADVKRISDLLTCLPVCLGEASIKEANNAVTVAQDHQQSLESTRSEVESKIASIKAAIDTANDSAKQLAGANGQCEALSREMAFWNLLAMACSNDGIVALSIDDAAPSIARLANQLLDDCYGGRFQLRLATQTATAAGILKEGFDILVNDVLRGEEKSIDQMSGGERVWVNECLVRAFSLYMTQASGQHFSTLFTDEADGPLDPERKRQFMAMKRAVLKVGGYKQEFFISQTPELWEMADQVIDIRSL